MKLQLKAGSTSNIVQVFIQDSSSTTGAGLTGLVFNSAGLTAYYHKDADTTATAISLVTMTVGTFTSSGFKEIDATNMPGFYQLCIPDAALSSGKNMAILLKGATNMAMLPLEIQLVSYDPYDTVRLGLTALPNAAAAASGGLHILGTNATAVSYTAGMTFSSASGPGLTCSSSNATSAGASFAGNTSGAGILATGGTTGNGVKIVGGSSSGDGLISSSTVGSGITANGGGGAHGISASGQGSGAGISCNGGLTGNGIKAVGGGTSGDGVNITATSGHGISTSAGGTSKHGISLVGGGTSGNGINALAISGTGIYAQGGGNGTGITFGGAGSGDGIFVFPGSTGNGLRITGGSSSGDGINITTTSGHGISSTATGTSKHGMTLTGGTSGNGLTCTAGTSGGGLVANQIIVANAITGTLSSTQATTSLTSTTDSLYVGRSIVWQTGALAGSACAITAYVGSTKLLTFTATPSGASPSNGDTFEIV